ncbi:MAG TPA: response regulator [Polyangiaceae bacterium]|nr:response regulator [Polyangiaceae bacterium]
MNHSESRVLIVAGEGQRELLASTVARVDSTIAIAFAGNSAEALSILEREPFALMLLDSAIDIRAVELLAQLRAKEGAVGMAIIVLVAPGEAHARTLAFEAGALDVLVKPIDPLELGYETRALLRLSQHAEQRAQQAELAAEGKLAQSQKMEAVAMLAGGIAHDFNNILAVILSFAGFASEGLSAGDKRYSDINEVIKAANRAARLTRQLLTVTSQQPSELEPTDLNQRLGELGNLISAAAGPAVYVTVALGVAPAVVELDPAQFDQVVLNLVVNAREAMPNGGKLQLSIDSDSDRQDRKTRSVRLVVTDSGIGMDEQTQRRIFEPFFTTKGKGKGLGLASCFGIVEACGGSIRVSSEPGQGSTFKVEFPLSTHVLAKAPRSAQTEPQGSGENVLLVEDEATLLRALVRVFESAGYHVHSAADGESAKRVIDELGGRLDAVVTDVILPGVGGDEVALHAARAAPNAVIFLTSGYLDGARNDGEFPILWKPIPPREIARSVARALAERKGSQRQSSSSPSATSPVVLVVEDDEAAQQALSRILSSAGFTTKLAGSLREARDVLETQGDPEIVLCDLSLPDGSGSELLNWIQTARPALRDRVFVLTGSAGAASTRQLLAGGSFPVLSKLTPPAQLLSLLNAACRATTPTVESKRPSAGALSLPAKGDDMHRERVLIVNDDEVLVQASKRMLKVAGFEVASATTRAEAVRLLNSREFSVLVVDAAMAESDDPGSSDELRNAQLPTVVLTTSPVQPASIRAARRQATEYLMKPFSAEALRTAARRVIDSERAARIRRQLLAAHHGGDDFQADLAATAATFGRALSRIEVAFQPVVRSGDCSIFGFEALLRCTEPDFISPARLLAASQVLGRQHDLGRAVRTAVATTLRDHPQHEEIIFVNIDPAELGDGLLIEESDPLLPFARRVVFEVSERAALVGGDSGLEKRLSRLRERGYRLALDDLGEGYSGLSSLATVLPDIVKIDTSLVRDIHRSALKRDIVVSLLQTARRAGIIVVAEGVETAGERELLCQLGCDLMQGYLFAKPGPAFPVPVFRAE